MRAFCFLAYLAIVSAVEVPHLLQLVTALKPGQETEIKSEVGQVPHVGVGDVPHVGVGHVPHVGVGHVPHMGVGHVPHVGVGHVPHESVGHVPHVGVGHVPHVGVGHVPHVGVGHVPHLHGQVQSHTHREGHVAGQQVPQIHGSVVATQPQGPHNVQQVNKNVPQVINHQATGILLNKKGGNAQNPQTVHQQVGHTHQHAPHATSHHVAHLAPNAVGNHAHQHVAPHVVQDKLIELQLPHVHVSLPGIVPQNVAEKMQNLQQHVHQVMQHAQTHIPQVINHQLALKQKLEQKLKEEQTHNQQQVPHGPHEVQQVAHGQQLPTHVGQVPQVRFVQEPESSIKPVGVDRKTGRSLEDEPPKKCDFKCPRLDLTICATHDKCVREFRSQCELSKWNCLNTKKIFLQTDDAECQDPKKIKCRPDLT